MAVFTNLMGPSPECVGEKSLGEDAWCFAFETGERAVLVLWSPYEPVEIAIPEAGGLDFMGNALHGDAVTLTSAPVYFLGPAGSAADLLAATRLAR